MSEGEPEPEPAGEPQAARRRVRLPVPDPVRALCLLVAVAFAITSLRLRDRIPVNVSDAKYDDGLFVKLATTLQHGRWLGVMDQLTLVKGPGYPLFVAGTDAIGLPLKTGEQLTQLLAAATLAACVLVVTRLPVPATIAFVVLALDPAMFADVNAHVRRDGWYASLAVLSVASAFLAAHLAVRGPWPGSRARSSVPLAVGAALLAGISLAALWLCRDESVWILPAIGLAVLAACAGPLVAALRRGRPWRFRIDAAIRVPLALAIFAATAIVLVAAVAAKNGDEYGVPYVNDSTAGGYADAVAVWATVEAGEPQPYVSISRAQREAVYRVSWSARQLRTALEAPRNQWRVRSNASCADRGICDQYASWLQSFALRDAAAEDGHYRGHGDSQRFWTAVADEIRAACANGRLTCRDHGSTPAALRGAEPGPVLAATARGLGYVATGDALTAPPATEAPPPGPPRLPAPQYVRTRFANVVAGTAPDRDAAVAERAEYLGSRSVYGALAGSYGVLLPALAVLGALGTLAGLALRRHAATGLSWLAVTVAVALLARIGLLAIVDTTVLPLAVETPTYQQAARSLLLAFAVTGTIQLGVVAASLVRSGLAGRRRPAAGPGVV